MYSTISTLRPSLGISPRSVGRPGRRLVAKCNAMKSMHKAIAGVAGVRRCCAIAQIGIGELIPITVWQTIAILLHSLPNQQLSPDMTWMSINGPFVRSPDCRWRRSQAV